jgi:hypothetical protein
MKVKVALEFFIASFQYVVYGLQLFDSSSQTLFLCFQRLASFCVLGLQ